MEKQGGEPPSYAHEGHGYGAPQAPPSYNQAQSNPQYPPQQAYPTQPYPQQSYPQQPYPGGAPPPPQGYQYQQYPNVIVQQPVGVVGNTGAPPPDHMTAAIFATLCCFWPTGIIAIMKASDAKNAWMRGDINGAHGLARSAKTMVNVSIVIGICSIIFLAIIVGVYVGVILKNIDDYDSDSYYD